MAPLTHDVESFNAEGEISQSDMECASGSNFGWRGYQEGISSGRAKKYTENATDEEDRGLWRTYWDEVAFFDENMSDASC